MAMEFVPGASLHERHRRRGGRSGTRLPVADVIRWGIQIARALHAAHQAGHRPSRREALEHPDRDRRPRGAARLRPRSRGRRRDPHRVRTRSADRRNTRHPSRSAQGAGRSTRAPTSISLGATLYEALAGVAPFRGETREQLFHDDPRARSGAACGALEPSTAARPRDRRPRRAREGAPRGDTRPRRRSRRTSKPCATDGPSPCGRRRPLGRLARWARRQPAKAALAAIAIAGVPSSARSAGSSPRTCRKIETRTRPSARARPRARSSRRRSSSTAKGRAGPAQPMFEEALRVDPGSRWGARGARAGADREATAAGALAFLDAAAAGGRHRRVASAPAAAPMALDALRQERRRRTPTS